MATKKAAAFEPIDKSVRYMAQARAEGLNLTSRTLEVKREPQALLAQIEDAPRAKVEKLLAFDKRNRKPGPDTSLSVLREAVWYCLRTGRLTLADVSAVFGE